jgi:hypothetical protein
MCKWTLKSRNELHCENELNNRQLPIDHSIEEHKRLQSAKWEGTATNLVTYKFRIALSTNILESLLSSISQAQEQCTIFSSIIRYNTQTLT